MAVEVAFHRLAAREYRSAKAWYRSASPELGARFTQAVDAAVSRIEAAPDSLPRLGRNYRRVRVTQFPYLLVFRPTREGEVIVVALAHTSRRPGYWHGRK